MVRSDAKFNEAAWILSTMANAQPRPQDATATGSAGARFSRASSSASSNIPVKRDERLVRDPFQLGRGDRAELRLLLRVPSELGGWPVYRRLMPRGKAGRGRRRAC